MTEAVILALIALVGLVLFLIAVIILVKMVLNAAPAHFEFSTEHGHVEVSFNTKVDE